MSDLIIKQGKEENYMPELFIKVKVKQKGFVDILEQKISNQLITEYPGLSLEEIEPELYHLIIPESYRVGHEAHFTQVVDKYIEYLDAGSLPDWEVPNMKSKYFITTEGYKMALRKN